MLFAIAAFVVALVVFEARSAAAEDVSGAPLRGCGSRAETGRPQRGPATGDVRIGPAYFAHAGQFADMAPSGFEPRIPAARFRLKVGFVLRAGTRATLVIAEPGRTVAALAFAKPPHLRPPFTVENGGLAVRFRACRAGQRAFSHDGKVGRWTVFPGEILLTGSGCVPLELREAAGRVHRATLSFGAGAC